MIFSSKAEYGVRLMVELGRQSPEQPTSLKAIADAEGLPLAYLEQVVARLRKAGLVMSARGAHGGYWLARPAEEIAMDEVVQALEGAIAPMECFVHDHTERVLCSHSPMPVAAARPSCCGRACRAGSSARCRRRRWPSWSSSRAAASAVADGRGLKRQNRKLEMADLEIRNLHVRAGEKEILRGLDLTVAQGRDPRPDGAQRLGQVDAGQRDHGPSRTSR